MTISKHQIKHFRSLQSSQGRKEAGQFLVEGALLVQEALQEGWPLETVLMTQEFAQSEAGEKLLRLILSSDLTPEYCSLRELDRLAEAVTPQGVLAIARIPDTVKPKSRPRAEPILLICEEISDPGNLGTIIRTADWFGMVQVVLGPGSADPFSPKVVRASAGSIFRTRVTLQENLLGWVEEEALKGRKLYAATLTGELNPAQLPVKGLRGLVVGHEKRGISPELQRRCAATVQIPRRGRCESLNLAVATGILLHSMTTPDKSR